MKRPWRAILAVVAVLFIVAVALSLGTKPAPVRFPSPNGFADLEAAHAAITPWRLDQPALRSRTTADQQKILLFNAKALELAREGLAKDIRVEVASPATRAYWSRLDSLVHLFQIEADFSRATADTNRLLAAEFALLDITSKATTGLSFDDGAFLTKTRRRVLEHLPHVADLKDPALCRAVALKLHESMARTQMLEDYLANQRRRESTSPALDRIWRTFSPVQVYSRHLGEQRQRRLAFAEDLKALRQLESETLRDLAAASFRLEHGRAATNWTELVPEYLPEVPRNATNNVTLPLDVAGQR